MNVYWVHHWRKVILDSGNTHGWWMKNLNPVWYGYPLMTSNNYFAVGQERRNYVSVPSEATNTSTTASAEVKLSKIQFQKLAEKFLYESPGRQMRLDQFLTEWEKRMGFRLTYYCGHSKFINLLEETKSIQVIYHTYVSFLHLSLLFLLFSLSPFPLSCCYFFLPISLPPSPCWLSLCLFLSMLPSFLIFASQAPK